MSKINLLGFTLEQLKSEFLKTGLTDLDAKRVFPWIHVKLAQSFNSMSDVPLNVRDFLQSNYSIDRPECSTVQKSSDETQKALLKLEDGNCIETVLIPEAKRTTVCVSSQIGCPIGCKFCYTGTQKFVRNLTSSEIISQIFFWKDRFEKPITNIVFMGMGEPLLNFENLSNTIELLLDEKAHNFSRHKITVSTSGVIENEIINLARWGIKLAISLHASNDEKRSYLMPINKKYDIKTLLTAAKKYQKISRTDHITFEYLLLKDINDTDSDASELIKLLKFIRCKVNLITFNSWLGSQFIGSDGNRVQNFLSTLLSSGIRAIVRKSRGNDILAACGQLKGRSSR
ncbi:MAG: 23S rRNA (adenine(2503)-C(2))-methyltransferase RlmN [Holosporaceae bacterium]|jgi:23S rRNA (adenine2503-C2)-methyltransferase|nr:23S rRNA (adenine(2503)-C(2))-methyltransferase RlmN [Holosporaceae bacterium]